MTHTLTHAHTLIPSDITRYKLLLMQSYKLDQLDVLFRKTYSFFPHVFLAIISGDLERDCNRVQHSNPQVRLVSVQANMHEQKGSTLCKSVLHSVAVTLHSVAVTKSQDALQERDENNENNNNNLPQRVSTCVQNSTRGGKKAR